MVLYGAGTVATVGEAEAMYRVVPGLMQIMAWLAATDPLYAKLEFSIHLSATLLL